MSERVDVLYRIVARTGDIVYTLRDITRKDVLREAERCDRVFPTQAPHIVIRVTTNDDRKARDVAAHRDRTAEREAAKKAWDAAAERRYGPGWPLHSSSDKARDAYLAAEFDAGERVTLSDGSVVTLSGCGNYLVVTSHSEPPRTWRVDQWRHVPHTGADFDAVKRLAEQRGAER